MAIARPDIPPVEAVIVEIARLRECCEKDKSSWVCRVFENRGNSRGRIRQVLEGLETGHQIEFSVRTQRVLRRHRIVRHCQREAARAKYRAKHVVAATVVEHTRFTLIRTP